jgi:hypothetical protein
MVRPLSTQRGRPQSPALFCWPPSQQGLFVVMATTSHGSPGHPAGASFGEGAMRRAGVLREHPLFFWASGHKNKGDVENRQPHQEHRRQQRGFGEELGNHKTHPKKHRGDHDGGEIRSHRRMLTGSPTGCRDLPWTVACLHPTAQQKAPALERGQGQEPTGASGYLV